MKSKVTAIAAAFVLVSGASVAFGASDAGAKLRTWFDAQFNPTKVVVEKDVKAYLSDEMDSFHNEFNGLISEGVTTIQDTGISETGKAKDGIETAATEHIDSISNTKKEIERYMDSEFGKLKSDAETRLNEATAEFKNDGYMRRQLNAEASTARKTLTDELNASKSSALNDLENAIEGAKSEILTSLQQKSATTTEEIMLKIDSKIDALRITFSEAQQQIVSVHRVAIKELAEKLESEAKKAMQDLVNGI